MEEEWLLNGKGVDKIEDTDLKEKMKEMAKDSLSKMIELDKKTIAKKEIMIELYKKDNFMLKEPTFRFEQDKSYLDAVRDEILLMWEMELIKDKATLESHIAEFKDKYGDE